MDNRVLPPVVRTEQFSNVYISKGNGKIKKLLMDGFDALGGIGKIVKPGQSVLIKVNCVEGHEPITGGISDPRMVEAVIELLKQYCQPGRIIVGEQTDTGDVLRKAFIRDGWVDMCERQNVELMDFEYVERVDVDLPDAMYMKKINLPKIFLDADVLLSMTVLKNHDTVAVTGGVKNSFGCVADPTRREAHRDNAIEQYLTDIARIRHADFVIVDGRIGMEGIAGGAHFEHPRYANRIIMGNDPVAVDTVCAHIMEQNPRVMYLKWCNDYGVGCNNLDYINIYGMSLEEAQVPFMTPAEEIEEITGNKFHLIDCNSCSQCRSVAQATLRRFNSPESVLDNVDVVYGPGDLDVSQLTAEKCLLIGDCVQERYRSLGTWIPGCPMDRETYMKALSDFNIVCTKCADKVKEFVEKHTEEELKYVRIVASGKTVFKGKENQALDTDSIICVGECEAKYGFMAGIRCKNAQKALGIEGSFDPALIIAVVPTHDPDMEFMEAELKRLNESRPQVIEALSKAKAAE